MVRTAMLRRKILSPDHIFILLKLQRLMAYRDDSRKGGVVRAREQRCKTRPKLG